MSKKKGPHKPSVEEIHDYLQEFARSKKGARYNHFHGIDLYMESERMWEWYEQQVPPGRPWVMANGNALEQWKLAANGWLRRTFEKQQKYKKQAHMGMTLEYQEALREWQRMNTSLPFAEVFMPVQRYGRTQFIKRGLA